jgi:anhydro-N-acetylmuramic acid kinase
VAPNITDRTARPEIVAEAEAVVNDAHTEAVTTFLTANSIPPRATSPCGFHGTRLL